MKIFTETNNIVCKIIREKKIKTQFAITNISLQYYVSQLTRLPVLSTFDYLEFIITSVYTNLKNDKKKNSS